MPICPICSEPLEAVRQREGVFYPCPTCDGRAVTISQIRRELGDRIATRLLQLIKTGRQSSAHLCPFCNKPMLRVNAPEPPLELESCRACAVVWFDLPTFELLPRLRVETMNSIPLEATEIIALNRLKELKEREEAEKQREKNKRLKRLVFGIRSDE